MIASVLITYLISFLYIFNFFFTTISHFHNTISFKATSTSIIILFHINRTWSSRLLLILLLLWLKVLIVLILLFIFLLILVMINNWLFRWFRRRHFNESFFTLISQVIEHLSSIFLNTRIQKIITLLS